MTTTNVSDPRARVRTLLGQITVTSLETGKALADQAKRGRVIAACRGYESTLVSIDFGSTSLTEVRDALDALRDPSARAHEAIQTSARETRTVHLDGGTEEGNALYSRCDDCVDTHEGATTEYWGTTADCHTWRVHLHRTVQP